MDLGGGSTQIVFEPDAEIPNGPHKVMVPFLEKQYFLYQKSYDGYGLMQGRKKSIAKGGCGSETHTSCVVLISSLFDKSQACPLSPCSFDGVYMPSLEEQFYDGEIYAFSYFYDVFAEPFGRIENGFKVGHIHEAVKETCSTKPKEDTCLDLGFIYSLLRVGYDLPKSRDLKTAKKIKGIETGWCLGAALALIEKTK
jgi:guanosine-diphosphatase